MAAAFEAGSLTGLVPAVVGHVDLQRRRPVAQAYFDGNSAGVLVGVGHRLLHHAEAGELEARRECSDVTFHLHVHGKTGVAQA